MLAELNKQALLSLLRQQLDEELEGVAAAQRATAAGATHEESKPENDKDTRAIESSYLARGQARRVDELGKALTTLSALQLRAYQSDTPIAVTALLALEDEEEQLDVVFLVPAAGGLRCSLDGVQVTTVTTRSPLGRALLGAQQGDVVEVPAPNGARELTIVEVA